MKEAGAILDWERRWNSRKGSPIEFTERIKYFNNKMMHNVDNMTSKKQQEVIQTMLDIAHRLTHDRVGVRTV
jgi:hypothetical protein